MMELTLEHGLAYRLTRRDAAMKLADAPMGAEAGWMGARGGSGRLTVGEGGSVELPECAVPDLIAIEWEGGAATVELVAAHYADLARILAHGGEQGRPIDLGRTEAEALGARARAEAVIEGCAGRAFTPRLAVERVWAPKGAAPLSWPDATESVTEGAAVLPGGWAALADPPGPATVAYLHGMAACPADVAWACEELAASYLIVGAVPYRATSMSTSDGVMSYSIAGRDGATGIPEVDEVIARHRIRRHKVV